MLHQLGAGVLGPVFRAVSETEDDRMRAAAVKLFVFDFTPEQARDCADALQRLASVEPSHPSLVRMLFAGTEGSLVYLAQAFVSGIPLDALLRDRGPLSLVDALTLLKQLGGAIAAAAAEGMPHGRLHPRDILVSPPNAWITGHGVARILQEAGVKAPLRRPYTSPERLAGQSWDARADVYSLGAVAYELITGRRAGATGDSTFFDQGASQLDPALHEVFARALASDPVTRFDTATAFVDALSLAAFPQPSIQARPPDEGILIDLSAESDLPPRGGRYEDAVGTALQVGRSLRHPRSFGWLAATVVLAVGLTLGFGAGYVVARRTVPAPRRVPLVETRATGGSAATAREWTDSQVAEPPAPPVPPEESSKVVAEAPVVHPTARRPDPAPTRREIVPEVVSASGDRPGTLAVRTRPAGARVFLNGRVVGVTPLILTDVAAGSHRVGLELAGYRRWSAPVRVGPGRRHDITASLDRVR